jgi:hypothetical protein
MPFNRVLSFCWHSADGKCGAGFAPPPRRTEHAGSSHSRRWTPSHGAVETATESAGGDCFKRWRHPSPKAPNLAKLRGWEQKLERRQSIPAHQSMVSIQSQKFVAPTYRRSPDLVRPVTNPLGLLPNPSIAHAEKTCAIVVKCCHFKVEL